MKYIIPIDKTTIRANPRAGSTTYYLPGQPVKTEDEKGTRIEHPVQILHSLTPAPKYLYDYVPTTVECIWCHATFPHTELYEDEICDDCLVENICPECKVGDCCEIKMEKFDASKI